MFDHSIFGPDFHLLFRQELGSCIRANRASGDQYEGVILYLSTSDGGQDPVPNVPSEKESI